MPEQGRELEEIAMVVVPLNRESDAGAPVDGADDSMNWVRIAAAGTLAAGGALMLTGYRKAGLVTAVSGVALAMIDQQDTVKKWWDMLPGFLEEMQGMLSRAETAVVDLSNQSQKLRKALAK